MKLILTLLLATTLFSQSFEVADAVMLTGTAGLIYYGWQEGEPNQPPHHRLKQGLGINGWHTFHLAQGTIYGWIRQQDSVRDWLWWHGFPEWFADPSKNLLMLENLGIALIWEGLELVFEPRPYDEVYGSWENARKDNWMDVAMSMMGCYATTELPWLHSIIFWNNGISVRIKV
ncbi:MAG: hypothetical protein H8D23_08965 [Candidatus Brocadiales bacterium]|nr:hypothetical protein [Candidatus Brocadiales bacterium]